MRDTNTIKTLQKILKIDISCSEISFSIKTPQIFSIIGYMNPSQRHSCSKSLQNQPIWVVPNSDCVFCVMNNHFLLTIGEKSLNFWGFINFNVPYQHLVLEIPYLKLFRSVNNHKMRCQSYFKYLIPQHNSITSNGEKIFSCLYSMHWDCFFIAVADTSISIIILYILDDEFLANVNNFVNLFAC